MCFFLEPFYTLFLFCNRNIARFENGAFKVLLNLNTVFFKPHCMYNDVRTIVLVGRIVECPVVRDHGVGAVNFPGHVEVVFRDVVHVAADEVQGVHVPR